MFDDVCFFFFKGMLLYVVIWYDWSFVANVRLHLFSGGDTGRARCREQGSGSHSDLIEGDKLGNWWLVAGE